MHFRTHLKWQSLLQCDYRACVVRVVNIWVCYDELHWHELHWQDCVGWQSCFPEWRFFKLKELKEGLQNETHKEKIQCEVKRIGAWQRLKKKTKNQDSSYCCFFANLAFLTTQSAFAAAVVLDAAHRGKLNILMPLLKYFLRHNPVKSERTEVYLNISHF